MYFCIFFCVTIHLTLVEIKFEEVRDLYSSPNNVRVIKLRRMGWEEYVTRMGEREMGTE